MSEGINIMEVELIFMKDFLHFPEGPRFDDEGNLYFGDALDDGFYRFSEAKGIKKIDNLASGVGGVVIHEDGGVVYSEARSILLHLREAFHLSRDSCFAWMLTEALHDCVMWEFQMELHSHLWVAPCIFRRVEKAFLAMI